jgi:hypothetical protein
MRPFKPVNAVARQLDPMRFAPARAVSKDMPEMTVGYDESFVVELFDRYGLEIVRPIHYGSWSGRKDYLSFQNLLVAWKVSR